MITKITGETPFQVLTNNFSISPSQEGYTLQISADGSNYSDLFAVSAGQTRMVSNVAANSYYRLKGNNSEVTVNWLKTCVTDGGGGDLSNYYTKSETDAEIENAISAYTPTSGFSTINGSAITNGGNIVIEGGSGPVDLNPVFPRVPIYDITAESIEDIKSALFDVDGNDEPKSQIGLLTSTFDWPDDNNRGDDWSEAIGNDAGPWFTIDTEEMVAYIENIPAGSYTFGLYKTGPGENYDPDFEIYYFTKEHENYESTYAQNTLNIWSDPDFEIDEFWENKVAGDVFITSDGFNPIWSFPKDVERLEFRIVDDDYVEVNVTYKNDADSSVLKGTMEFPEEAEIGDMISKVDEMPTFWWNDSDNTTRKMHIDLDTLDTGETYPVLSFLNEDGEPLYGRLEYNFGWKINFYDEDDNLASALTLTSTRAANPNINIPLEDGYYAGIGYLDDDFTGLGGKMLQIGRTDGTFGEWDGTVDEIPELTTEEIDIDGIPGIPSATGPYYLNGAEWVSVAEMAQNGIYNYLNQDVFPRLDDAQDDITTLTDDLNDLAAELSEAERVTAVSINDIRDKMVTSMDVKTIVKLSQAAYDALSTKDATTLYIITGTTI